MLYDVPSNIEDNRCFLCGPHNPSGLHLTFRVNEQGDELHSEITFEERFCGFTQIAHGGLQTAVLDEVSVWAVAALKQRMTITRTLAVQFLRPVRVGEPMLAAARISKHQDDRFTVEARLLDGNGRPCTTSEAVLVAMRPAHFRRFTGQREVPPVWQALIH